MFGFLRRRPQQEVQSALSPESTAEHERDVIRGTVELEHAKDQLRDQERRILNLEFERRVLRGNRPVRDDS